MDQIKIHGVNQVYLISWLIVTPLTIIVYKFTNFNLTIKQWLSKQNVTNNSTSLSHSTKKRVFIIIINWLLLILNVHVWFIVVSSILEDSTPFLTTTNGVTNNDNQIIKNLNSVSNSIKNLNYTNISFYVYSNTDKVEEDKESCQDIEILVNDEISVSEPKLLDSESELFEIRQIAMSMLDSYPILRYAFREYPDEDVKEFIKTKWYHFGASSTWLELYNVHYMVKRVIYATRNARDAPTLSFVYAKIFDKEWNELKGFQFPHDNQTTYPTILKLRVDEVKSKGWDDDVMGPEDPRILTRKYFNEIKGEMDEEPVIIYNAKTSDIEFKRAIHFHRAFSAPNEVFRLRIMNNDGIELPPKDTEKNWTPFFDIDSNESINFIYNYKPLTILKCKLDSGECRIIHGGHIDGQTATDLRGGSNLISFPIQNDYGKTYWFGLAKSHIKHCNCMKEIYRPNAIILSKDENNKFSINYVTSLLDFNIDTDTWIAKYSNDKCKDDKSVLSPNSVAFLDTESDIIGFTFSEADHSSEIVFSKGWVKHLTHIIGGHSTNDLDNFQIGQCSSVTAQSYCEAMIQTYRR